MDIAVVDGRLLPLAEATVSVADLGFLRGCGAFETLATYDGHPHAVADHLARLADCCRDLGIDLPFDEAGFRRQVAAMRAESGYPDLRVNVIVTPGRLTDGVFGADRPTWVLIGKRLHPPTAASIADGIEAVTFTGRRALPEVKATTYITGKRGMDLAAAAGAQEALYRNRREEILEGVTSNVHALVGDEVRSPSAGVLSGITRDRLHDLVRSHGLGWKEAPVTLAELDAVDEFWITSSIRELLPVVAIDARPIGDGRPGPWAGSLRAELHRRLREEAAADAAEFASR